MQRRGAMTGVEALDLPAAFSRLDFGSEAVSSGRALSSAALPTDPPHERPLVLEEEDVFPSGSVVSSGSSGPQGLHQSAYGRGTSRLGSTEEKKGEEGAAGGESVESAANA